ncbi:MAG TPA: response regulator [Desulfuromonadales bacterium]|nr:response regulator [Desulfuromonadales bacterium]
MSTKNEAIDVMSQYTVVMVDDEQNILQSLKRCFRREQYTVVCAGSGAEGLKLIAATADIAVIISDQRMPEMNGSEFLTRSRELAPDAIRMLLTGYSDMETTVAAMNEGGATHYIGKPWEDSALLQTVRDGVSHYHLTMENRRQQEIINRQNEELLSWNQNLKSRVLAQTVQIRTQIDELRALNLSQQNNFHGMIESLAALVELRVPKSRHHFAATAALSVAMAHSLGLPDHEIETIRTAALLHDIGKNAMSDHALARDDDSFIDDELLKYRTHPVLGQTAIDSIADMRPAGVLIRHHHERYDGSGFPDGLSGDAIPIGSAIIALADLCDREMSRQSGRNAVDLALETIGQQAGKAFLPLLLPHLTAPAHELFDHRFALHDELHEREVAAIKLSAGMMLTRDLFSRSGLLLLQAWTELDEAKIFALQRIFTIEPKADGIYVAMHTKPANA